MTKPGARDRFPTGDLCLSRRFLEGGFDVSRDGFRRSCVSISHLTHTNGLLAITTIAEASRGAERVNKNASFHDARRPRRLTRAISTRRATRRAH